MSIFDKIKSVITTQKSNKGYPIIKEVVNLAAHYPYHYDTIYKVWIEWDKDIKVTESTLYTAMELGVDPLYITKDSVERLSEVIRDNGISAEEAANNMYNSLKN